MIILQFFDGYYIPSKYVKQLWSQSTGKIESQPSLAGNILNIAGGTIYSSAPNTPVTPSTPFIPPSTASAIYPPKSKYRNTALSFIRAPDSPNFVHHSTYYPRSNSVVSDVHYVGSFSSFFCPLPFPSIPSFSLFLPLLPSPFSISSSALSLLSLYFIPFSPLSLLSLYSFPFSPLSLLSLSIPSPSPLYPFFLSLFHPLLPSSLLSSLFYLLLRSILSSFPSPLFPSLLSPSPYPFPFALILSHFPFSLSLPICPYPFPFPLLLILSYFLFAYGMRWYDNGGVFSEESSILLTKGDILDGKILQSYKKEQILQLRSCVEKMDGLRKTTDLTRSKIKDLLEKRNLIFTKVSFFSLFPSLSLLLSLPFPSCSFPLPFPLSFPPLSPSLSLLLSLSFPSFFPSPFPPSFPPLSLPLSLSLVTDSAWAKQD